MISGTYRRSPGLSPPPWDRRTASSSGKFYFFFHSAGRTGSVPSPLSGKFVHSLQRAAVRTCPLLESLLGPDDEPLTSPYRMIEGDRPFAIVAAQHVCAQYPHSYPGAAQLETDVSMLRNTTEKQSELTPVNCDHMVSFCTALLSALPVPLAPVHREVLPDCGPV